MIDYSTHPWTEEELAQLPKLWADGLSSLAIGRHLGKTKNSIVGRVRRLNLPHRPSPIRPPSELTKEERRRNAYYKRKNRAPPPDRPGMVSLPTLASIKPGNAQAKEARAAAIPLMPRMHDPIKLPPLLSNSPCCWPIGDPKSKNFKFCCEPAQLGKSYCYRHHKIAYITIRDRREDYAAPLSA